MNLATVHYLNQLNQTFYQTVANSFDVTRSTPWQGWTALLPYIKKPAGSLRVLDLGGGNGRFGVFLADHWGKNIHYTGVDSSEFLLSRAAESLAEIPHELHQADLLADEFPLTPPYDLVVIFGVLHHIPGFENRRALIERAAGWLSDGGVLALTFWAFYEQSRWRGRIIPWETLSPELTLEDGDYLLDWQRDTHALRYCHYVNQTEETRLLAGMNIIGRYEADSANRYIVASR